MNEAGARPPVTLVDSNIFLDLITEDQQWAPWSERKLKEVSGQGPVVINPIVYSEVSVGYSTLGELDAVLPDDLYHRAPLPWSAAFLAAKCFQDYRRRGGEKRSPLPDFYIGAHSAVSRLRLLTRDARRYRVYFPTVEVIAPD
ncbi:type II toxin-antitoxin system VapC family toxin [Saccharopolyspora spinosa]|uniref:type II toxin-antitoxin system VapC family toxin n=1 Tax=Saccharopolyspora spinosa TaxID=60894 RepID=UPI00049731CA|nr:type II toxin-antitoxin system VapC family toxin [Saccharopolyspora spinosa]